MVASCSTDKILERVVDWLPAERWRLPNSRHGHRCVGRPEFVSKQWRVSYDFPDVKLTRLHTASSAGALTVAL